MPSWQSARVNHWSRQGHRPSHRPAADCDPDHLCGFGDDADPG
jgi:hypothetical protein